MSKVAIRQDTAADQKHLHGKLPTIGGLSCHEVFPMPNNVLPAAASAACAVPRGPSIDTTAATAESAADATAARTGTASLPTPGGEVQAGLTWLPEPLQHDLYRYLPLRDANALARAAQQFRPLAATPYAESRAHHATTASDITELVSESRHAPPGTRVEIVRVLFGRALEFPAEARQRALSALAKAVCTFSSAQMQALLAAIAADAQNAAQQTMPTLQALFTSEQALLTLVKVAEDKTCTPALAWLGLFLAAPGIAALTTMRYQLAQRVALTLMNEVPLPTRPFGAGFGAVLEATLQAYTELSGRLGASRRSGPLASLEDEGEKAAALLLRLAIDRQRLRAEGKRNFVAGITAKLG
ncbi:hypothetical protein [Paracidovorax citrulli]